jgi:hypothetical protein
VLFQTYAGAALAGIELGLLSLQALEKVVLKSAEELRAVEFSRDSQRIAQRDLFLRDFARINVHLQTYGSTDLASDLMHQVWLRLGVC